MIRSLLSCLLLMATHASDAQSWCAPGAQWIFNFSSLQATGVRRAWYSGDTLVGGLQCQRIDQAVIAYEPVIPFGTPFTFQDSPIITQGQGDLIRLWDAVNNDFDTLVWYGAGPGDHWEFPQFAGVAHYDVLDTGTRVVQGIALHYLVVEEPVVMGVVDTLYERIGLAYYYLRPTETVLIDFVTYGLVCYRDTVIEEFDGWFPGHGCDFTVAVKEDEQRRIQPYPNPGSDRFTLRTPAGPHTIELFDATGRMTFQHRSSGEQVVIDTAHLPSGVYSVRVDDGSRCMRWVKEQE